VPFAEATLEQLDRVLNLNPLTLENDVMCPDLLISFVV
jgi:hypothetical protein